MELKRPTQPDLAQMSHAEKDALILALFDALEILTLRLDELERKVEKHSGNSSKPPSSDGLKKGAAQLRKRGEKAPGGQRGHRGSTRQMVDDPDHVVELRAEGCCACGASLAGLEAVVRERRQQIEIPESRHEITEYRQMQVTCPCGRDHYGAFPAGVAPHVSFGPRLKGYAVGLVLGHFVSLQRSCALIDAQYGVCLSDGTLQSWISRAAESLKPRHEGYQITLRNAEVAHFDESGLRINGQLNWLHVAASDTVVHYTAHAKRGQDAMEAAGILPTFRGCAVHDHWKCYWSYTDCTHALCNAHHLRELRYCEELTGHYWPVALRELLVEGKESVAAARAEGKTALDEAQVKELHRRYDEQIGHGLAACPVKPPDPGQKGRVKQQEATNLLIRLRDYKEQVLKFLTDWRVPFDNNRAEQMVRPIKVKLKVSGGFRAFDGAEAFCILRSVWETNKLQGLNPFDTLRMAFIG